MNGADVPGGYGLGRIVAQDMFGHFSAAGDQEFVIGWNSLGTYGYGQGPYPASNARPANPVVMVVSARAMRISSHNGMVTHTRSQSNIRGMAQYYRVRAIYVATPNGGAERVAGGGEGCCSVGPLHFY